MLLPGIPGSGLLVDERHLGVLGPGKLLSDTPASSRKERIGLHNKPGQMAVVL
jgi:hypothetical protein